MRRRTRSRVRPAGGYPSDRPRGRRWWCVRRRACAAAALSTSASAGSASSASSPKYIRVNACTSMPRANTATLTCGACGGPVRGLNRAGFDGVEAKRPVGIGRAAAKAEEGRIERRRAGVEGVSIAAVRVGLPDLDERVLDRASDAVEHLSLDTNALASVRSLDQDVLRLRRPRQANPEERAHGLRRCLPRRRHQRASIGVCAAAAQHDVEAVAERGARLRDVVIVARR